MEDIGLHQQIYGELYNVSEWKFVNETYFGYGCDQLMVSPSVWYMNVCNSTAGTCMNNVLSTWGPENGLQLFPSHSQLTSVSALFCFDCLNMNTFFNISLTLTDLSTKYLKFECHYFAK